MRKTILPIVGETEIARGREINWIRIERYWEGEYPDAKLKFIPMLCQQCDTAPCETVCPVSATYHNQDGLNAQVYNRCIGTRSCAVYCPYEVRYFNYYDHHWDAPLDQQLNPDVTVREKGVMEKCTFCIQRIRQAKDHAKDDGRRRVRDGEVQPACVQTCPTEALVFGDRLDPASRVSKSMNNPRAYRVLEELNTDAIGDIFEEGRCRWLIETTCSSPTSTETSCSLSFETGNRYYITLAIAVTVTLACFFFPWFYQLYYGIGAAGNNQPAVWGTYLASFIFWIGLSHSGTLAVLRAPHHEQ